MDQRPTVHTIPPQGVSMWDWGTHDVVFDETTKWDWGSGTEQGAAGSHDDIFKVEYAIENQVPSKLDGAIEVLDDDALGPEPMSPPSVHSSGGAVPIEDEEKEEEFVTPPSVHSKHLDADHDDVPLKFGKIDNIIGLTSPRGLASRALIAEELHNVSSDEPVSFAEVERLTGHFRASLKHKNDGKKFFIKPNSQI